MQVFHNYTTAKEAADSFFNDIFGYTNGAGILSEKRHQIEGSRFQMEFFSFDDPGMDDSFKCIVDYDLQTDELGTVVGDYVLPNF